MQILACLQDEVRNGHYKYKIPSAGKHSDKVVVGYSLLSLLNACCPRSTALAGPHRNTFRLCFVLIMFKTKKSFQAVLTIFLKYDLQCTFTRERTKARLPAMLTKCSGKHRSSPWVRFFGSVGVLLLSFMGEETHFSTKWFSEDNQVSTKRIKLLQEEPLFSEVVRALLVCTAWEPVAACKSSSNSTCFQEKPGSSGFSKSITARCSTADKAAVRTFYLSY